MGWIKSDQLLTVQNLLSFFHSLKRQLGSESKKIAFICSDSIESTFTSFFLLLSDHNVIFLNAETLKKNIAILDELNIDILVQNNSKVGISDVTITQVVTESMCFISETKENNEATSLIVLEELANIFGNDLQSSNNVNDSKKIFLSSGSTGSPKLIPLKISNINSCFENVKEAVLDETKFSDILVIHDSSFVIILPYLFAFCSKLNSTICARHCSSTISSIFWAATIKMSLSNPLVISVPSAYRMMLKLNILPYSNAQNNNLASFISCGEPLDSGLAKQLIMLNPLHFWNLYGSTEVSPWILFLDLLKFIDNIDGVENMPNILPAGCPLPNVNYEILKSELIVNSSSVFCGYLRRANNQTFVELNGINYFRTGDKFVVKDGLLFCEGRINSACKILGKFVNPVLVEASIRSKLKLDDCLVVGDSLNMKITIFFWDHGEITDHQIKKCAVESTFQGLPITVVRTNEPLKKLRSGKINRSHYAKINETKR